MRTDGSPPACSPDRGFSASAYVHHGHFSIGAELGRSSIPWDLYELRLVVLPYASGQPDVVTARLGACWLAAKHGLQIAPISQPPAHLRVASTIHATTTDNANAVEPVRDGRIFIELIYGVSLRAFRQNMNAGLKLAIDRGWLRLHESGM